MDPQYIEALINQLLKTGEILATKAFELAMRQILVLAIQHTIIAIFMVAVILMCSVFIKKVYKSNGASTFDDLDEPSGIVVFVMFLVQWIAAPIGVLISISNVIAYTINPEWYAVKLLLETFIK